MTEKLTIPDYRGLINAVDASFCSHIECECDLVYPEDWEKTAIESLLKVVLRCPNCESTRTGYMHREEVDHFSELMRIGHDVIESKLKEPIADEDLQF